MKDIQQRQYLIAGANSDIGYEITRQLVNAKVGKILAVTRRDFREHQTELIFSDNYLHLKGIDLTNTADLVKLKGEAEKFFDQPFTIIHSVGDFWLHKPLIETSLQEALSMINSHYFTLFGLIHSLLPVQQVLKGGRIIAFSCNSVGYNYPEMAAFTSAKAAVECLIKCIANEYSKDGIIANSLALSTIRTPTVEETKNPKYFDGYITVAELASLILEEICELSSSVNGNTIRLLKYSKYFYNEGYFQRNPSGHID